MEYVIISKVIKGIDYSISLMTRMIETSDTLGVHMSIVRGLES